MCFVAFLSVFPKRLKLSAIAFFVFSIKWVCLYVFNKGNENTNHQIAVIVKAIVIARLPEIPIFLPPRITASDNTKGIQDPIYPHAYPEEDTLSRRSSVVISPNMES